MELATKTNLTNMRPTCARKISDKTNCTKAVSSETSKTPLTLPPYIGEFPARGLPSAQETYPSITMPIPGPVRTHDSHETLTTCKTFWVRLHATSVSVQIICIQIHNPVVWLRGIVVRALWIVGFCKSLGYHRYSTSKTFFKE